VSRRVASWVLVLGIAAVVLLLDQWTKGLVEARVPMNGSLAPFPSLASYFNLVHYANTGAAFSFLRGQNSFFIVVALIVIGVVLYFMTTLPSDGHWAMRVCLGLMLGGAFGNLTDRIQNGHVTDFLLFSLPVGGRVYAWPAFNVADTCVVVGTILFGLLLMLEEGKKGESRQSAA
jgi:signal peptidase II